MNNTADTKNILKVVRTYKIGCTDEEGIAATETDLIHCDCCGRKIARVSVLSNGMSVGNECSDYLTEPRFRRTEKELLSFFGRHNKKADIILAEGNFA